MMKERNVGVDIAKILAIFFVMVHHVSDCGLTINLQTPTMLSWIHSLVHSVAYSCIDIFALATGYLCVDSKCKYSRLATLWLSAVFWGVLMLLLCQFVGGHEIVAKQYIKALMPVLGRQYWFLTAYFMLFLFMPLLNAAVSAMSKQEYNRFLAAVLIFMCGYTNLGVDPFGLSGGYSFLWLAVVYLFGAYIKRYSPIRIGSAKCFAIAMFFAFLPCLRQLFSLILGFRIPGDRFSFVAYPSVFTLFVAVFVFIGCLNLKYGAKVSRLARVVASTTFGVYLIHVQPFVWHNVWYATLEKIEVSTIPFYIGVTIGLSVMTFVILSAIEFVRLKLFDVLKVPQMLLKIDKVLPR